VTRPSRLNIRRWLVGHRMGEFADDQSSHEQENDRPAMEDELTHAGSLVPMPPACNFQLAPKTASDLGSSLEFTPEWTLRAPFTAFAYAASAVRSISISAVQTQGAALMSFDRCLVGVPPS
jgi:hypothetical protein